MKPQNIKMLLTKVYWHQNLKIKKLFILNKEDYINKLNHLVSDLRKFKPLQKDSTEALKMKGNKLITAVNSAQNDIKLNKIIGEFSPDIKRSNNSLNV